MPVDLPTRPVLFGTFFAVFGGLREAVEAAGSLEQQGCGSVRALTAGGSEVRVRETFIELRAPAVEFPLDVCPARLRSVAGCMMGYKYFHTCMNIAVFCCVRDAEFAVATFRDELRLHATLVQTAVRFT